MELLYGKKELEQIAKLYGVKNASKIKKDDLIKVLVEVIPEKLPEKLPMLDREDLERFEEVCKADIALDTEEELELYYNLMELELVQHQKDSESGKITVAAVDIVKDAYNSIDKEAILPIIDRNTKLRNYIKGILNLYGSVELKVASEIYKKLYDIDITATEIKTFVKEDMRLGFGTKVMDNYIVEETIYALDKSNFNAFIEARNKCDYYIPSLEMLEKLADDRYYEESLPIEKLRGNLKHKHNATDETIEEVVVAVNMICKVDNDRTGRVIDLILEEMAELGVEFKSFAQVQDMGKLVTQISRGVRKWINKGFTDQELSPHTFDERTGQKIKVLDIGRNDPCPCGSGKKYKKCCGANKK